MAFFPKLHGHYEYTVEYNWINLWHLETISHNLIMVWMLKAQQIYNKKSCRFSELRSDENRRKLVLENNMEYAANIIYHNLNFDL